MPEVFSSRMTAFSYFYFLRDLHASACSYAGSEYSTAFAISSWPCSVGWMPS